MQQQLMNINEAAEQISAGKTLLLAGDESLFKQLPQGKWIGGSIPYFISREEGGISSKDKLFVTDISEIAEEINIRSYDSKSIDDVYTDAGTGGISFIIIPASSSTHISFALNAPNFNNFGSQPLVGWISGVLLEDIDKIKPKVFNGETGEEFEDEALVMHVDMVKGKSVDVGIINLFEQGSEDTLTFEEKSFSTQDVFVNGKRVNYANYISKKNLDIKLPLVADYYGARVNISFQHASSNDGVAFYAPVFSGIEYKHAKPVDDYAAEFVRQIKENEVDGKTILFSCNCILNYLYSDLAGKQTEPFVGPLTFGEIAYQLLNQTLVYVDIED
ncbi:DUF6976 family protein [Maridesulfovibrio bastinii]|uniref:DUF6976 family protein n=1 Tax=Maridesulfovibrio bastinii TaxID=47157 RepID=UPI000415016F|nr:hypothetical protein [Maridesulfovibrio bastinii]